MAENRNDIIYFALFNNLFLALGGAASCRGPIWVRRVVNNI